MRLFYRALLSYLSVFSYLPVTSMQTVLRSLTLTPHQRFSLTYLFNFARKFLQVVLPKDTLRLPGVQNYFFASSTLFSNTFKSLLIKPLKSSDSIYCSTHKIQTSKSLFWAFKTHYDLISTYFYRHFYFSMLPKRYIPVKWA